MGQKLRGVGCRGAARWQLKHQLALPIRSPFTRRPRRPGTAQQGKWNTAQGTTVQGGDGAARAWGQPGLGRCMLTGQLHACAAPHLRRRQRRLHRGAARTKLFNIYPWHICAQAAVAQEGRAAAARGGGVAARGAGLLLPACHPFSLACAPLARDLISQRSTNASQSPPRVAATMEVDG